MSEQQKELPDTVVDAAIAWMVRVQSGEMSSAERSELDRWRSSHPTHELAWQRLLIIDGDFSAIAPEHRETARKTLELSEKQKRRRQTLKTLAWGTLGGGMLWGASQTPPARRLVADHATSVGEQSRFLLGDAEIRLNTDTIVDVEQSQRRLHLLRGEIHVAVAAGGGSLSINMAHGAVRANQAQFILRDMGSVARLAVLDGIASVAPRRRPEAAVEARSGDAFAVTPDEVVPEPLFERMNPSAWLDRLLVVRRMQLGDVIEELNRYQTGLIRVAPDVQSLEVSGVFRLDAVDQAILALEAQLPIRVSRFTQLLTLIEPS